MNTKDSTNSSSDKSTTEPLVILANTVQNGVLYDNPTFSGDSGPYQQLIANEHAHLPPGGAQFGVNQQFVTQFPTYMHTMPTSMYSLNMVEEQGDNSGKRRRRTNYRDPENAAKLTTALGILIKQKEENKPQDLKSIASHFGLPYNTLRDNYLKVTTGRLLKERVGDKRPAAAMIPKTEGDEGSDPASKMAKKSVSSVPRPGGSGNSSAANTPRERSGSSSTAAQVAGLPFVTNGGGVTQTFAPYPVFHPQVGMHFIPQLGMQNLQHMQHLPNGGVVTATPTMHHPMLNGAPQMMHMFAPAPLGYQINPANGRPFPVFAASSANSNNTLNAAEMQLQMQGQMMNPGMLAMTLPAAVNSSHANNSLNGNNPNIISGENSAGGTAVGDQSPHSTATSSTNPIQNNNNININNNVSAPISAPVTQLMMPSNMTTNALSTTTNNVPTTTNNNNMANGPGMYMPAPMPMMTMNMNMNMPPLSMPMAVPMPMQNMQGGMYPPQMMTLSADGVYNVNPNQFAQNYQNQNQNYQQHPQQQHQQLQQQQNGQQQQQQNNHHNSTASLLAAALSVACGPDQDPPEAQAPEETAQDTNGTTTKDSNDLNEPTKDALKDSSSKEDKEEDSSRAAADKSEPKTDTSIPATSTATVTTSASASTATVSTAPAPAPASRTVTSSSPPNKKKKIEKNPSPPSKPINSSKTAEAEKATPTVTAAPRATPMGTRRR